MCFVSVKVCVKVCVKLSVCINLCKCILSTERLTISGSFERYVAAGLLRIDKTCVRRPTAVSAIGLMERLGEIVILITVGGVSLKKIGFVCAVSMLVKSQCAGLKANDSHFFVGTDGQRRGLCMYRVYLCVHECFSL